jgi:hypothetical protein
VSENGRRNGDSRLCLRRKAETDRVVDGISDGFRLAESKKGRSERSCSEQRMPPASLHGEFRKGDREGTGRLAMPSPTPHHL